MLEDKEQLSLFLYNETVSKERVWSKNIGQCRNEVHLELNKQ